MATVTLPNGDRVLAGSIYDTTNSNVGSSPSASSSSTNNSNTADMINSQASMQQAAAAAQLQRVRDAAIAGYNTRIAGLQQTYQPLRDAQDFQGAKNVNATNEQMANMGINNSGDAVTAQIQNRVGNENALNSLNLQQNNDKTDLQNLIDQANSSYNSDLISSNANIDAQKLQALISQSNADRTYDYQVGRDKVTDTGYTSNGMQTLAGQTAAANIQAQSLQNAYQQLVNAGYSQEQAAKLAQEKAQTDGQNLQNAYQQLINQGYPAEQAAKLTGLNLNNQAQALQNQYLPQQLQASIAKSYSSGSGSSSGSSGSSSSVNSSNNTNNSNKSTTSDVNSNVNDVDAIVASKNYNKDDRIASLNTMLNYYSAIGGTQSEYMISYINKAIRSINGQGSLN